MADGFKTLKGDERTMVLANCVARAIDDALGKGLQVDQCTSIVATVAADYWRVTYGEKDLPGLAEVITMRAGDPLPRGQH